MLAKWLQNENNPARGEHEILKYAENRDLEPLGLSPIESPNDIVAQL